MQMLNWIRFLCGSALLLLGILIFALEVFGVYKFKYVLNRMHIAAIGDTMGLGCCMVGLIILCGLNFTSLKLALIIVFMWLASPVSSHLIARLEVITNENLEEQCQLPDEKGWKDELC